MRTREGDRETALADVLDAAVTSQLDAWLCRPRPAAGSGGVAGPDDPDGDASLRLLALTLSREWDDALALDRATPPPDPDDAPARWLRRGVRAWATSGDPAPEASDVLHPLLGDLPDTTGALGRFAAYLYVEGTLAHGRLDLAHAIVDAVGDVVWQPVVLGGSTHDFSAVVGACRARLFLFRGEVAAAGAVHRALPASPHPTVQAVSAATGCLVSGNDAAVAEVRRQAQVVRGLVAVPRDHLGAGAHLLVAFGLVAVGDVAAAVRSLLAAGRDADLGGCNVIDRTLGLELLVALAVAEGDQDAAEAWRDRAVPLLGSPIADSTVARIEARVHLLGGRASEAMVWAERAVTLGEERGRAIEAAEARILLNRARLANGGPLDRREATRALHELVAEAELRGHHAARRSAARELRPLGRRLPPLAGSGLTGLSAREAEVARWVAAGATNRQVAARLHVSEHTVRAHVSRILAAFGVATRSGLPAAMADSVGGPVGGPVVGPARPGGTAYPSLTARQEDVATMVAEGLSNREIGVRLDLSVRTVERHVGDVLQRWSLPGRTALAHAVRERADLLASASVDPDR